MKTVAPSLRPRLASGFSVMEVLVAAGINSILLVVLASFSYVGARNCASLANYSDLESQSRLALDRMSQQMRQTRGLTACTSTNLLFKDADGVNLEFVYSPSARTLTRIKAGVSTVLLQGCDYMRFDIFQRNPVQGTYDAYPTATAATCKLIQLTWICSRQLLRGQVNTESVQSAKIVIRKKD